MYGKHCHIFVLLILSLLETADGKWAHPGHLFHHSYAQYNQKMQQTSLKQQESCVALETCPHTFSQAGCLQAKC